MGPVELRRHSQIEPYHKRVRALKQSFRESQLAAPKCVFDPAKAPWLTHGVDRSKDPANRAGG